MTADPPLAAAVSEGLAGSVVPGTRASYATAVTSFVSFCDARGLVPFPADELLVCAYIRFKAMFIQHQSFGVYLAGIKYEHEMRGIEWSLDGSVLIRRMLRFIKRRYPRGDSVSKMPISLGVLRVILPLLPGWPVAAGMSHDHRLFAAASLIGTAGFLRGGEFLASPGSDRAVLNGVALSCQVISGAPAVVVQIPQPKARWWVASERVVCFEFDKEGPFNPVRALKSYRELSPIRLDPHLPAFRLSDGSSLSREWMVALTSRLVAEANISFVDGSGKPLAVRASSWRSGGVRTALDAGVSDATIMVLGRWRSVAWTRYAQSSYHDLQGVAASMWAAAAAPSSPPRRVEEFPLSSVIMQDDPLPAAPQAVTFGPGVHLQATAVEASPFYLRPGLRRALP